MDNTPHCSRRTALKTTGLLAAAGLPGVASTNDRGQKNGNGDDDTLRLFGEVAVDGAAEVVTQDTWAYVATGDGFAVVDWRNPNRPELVGTWDAPGTSIADVKVDGELLAVSTQGSEHDHEDSGGGGTVDPDAQIGTHFYDVTDPSTPEQTYEYDPDGAFLWTAVRARGFTVISDIGGGLAFLHEDHGVVRPPSFDGATVAPHHERKRAATETEGGE